VPQDKMEYYCELIAAINVRTSNKKGRHLSTGEAIRLIEEFGGTRQRPIEWDNVVLYGQYILDRKLVRQRRGAKRVVLVRGGIRVLPP
jgi:hypothetical protein